MTFRFELGDEVYDKLTSDDGVVIGRHAHGRERLYSVRFGRRQVARIVPESRLTGVNDVRRNGHQ